MQWSQHFILAVLCTVLFLNPSAGGDLECNADSSHRHRISVSVNSTMNNGGEWVTSFLAHQNSSDHPRSIDLNVTRNFVKCQKSHFIQIGGFLKDLPKEQEHAELTFIRCSKNAAIINNGRTLQKLKLDGYGSAFTNRPLKDDEIFTVNIDGKDGKFDHALGIGLTQLTPEGQDLQDHSYHYKSGTWMFYHSHLYQNGVVVNADYLKTNLKDVQVGQNVGVMRSKLGTLHLYIDGVEQGPAASNIPDKVYGIFELYGNVIKGTIIDT